MVCPVPQPAQQANKQSKQKKRGRERRTTRHGGLHLHYDVGEQNLDALDIRDMYCNAIVSCHGGAADDSGQVDGETGEPTIPSAADCRQKT